MTGDELNIPQGRPTVNARLRRWYPELCCSVCGGPRPRILIGDEEIEIQDEGEEHPEN